MPQNGRRPHRILSQRSGICVKPPNCRRYVSVRGITTSPILSTTSVLSVNTSANRLTPRRVIAERIASPAHRSRRSMRSSRQVGRISGTSARRWASRSSCESRNHQSSIPSRPSSRHRRLRRRSGHWRPDRNRRQSRHLSSRRQSPRHRWRALRQRPCDRRDPQRSALQRRPHRRQPRRCVPRQPCHRPRVVRPRRSSSALCCCSEWQAGGSDIAIRPDRPRPPRRASRQHRHVKSRLHRVRSRLRHVNSRLRHANSQRRLP